LSAAPQPSLFDGKTYDPALDEDRLATALGRIYDAMRDNGWWTLTQLAQVGRCTEAAASARIRDLRKIRFGSHHIEHVRVRGGLWRYRLLK
jgi:hypothetical protein